MKKLTAKLLVLTLLSTLIPLNTAFADFSDLNQDHQNYEAIQFLKQAGILNGYSDGTFRPNQSVNRAEFLKIVLEGSDIPLNKHQMTPFTDVDHSQWYAPYLRKAYREGWVNGYEDGTFRPTQTINKVEALKIIAAVQDWPLPEVTEQPFVDVEITAWYAPYITYAKSQEILEETGSTYNPGQLMTRANTSEIIYRSNDEIQIVQETTKTEAPKEEEEEEEILKEEPQEEIAQSKSPEINLNFTPVNHKEIPTSFYDPVHLDKRIPNTFYANEFYIIKGSLQSTTADYVTAFYEPADSSGGPAAAFSAEVNNGKFEIPVHFPDLGNYHLGILTGKSGKSKVEKISVLPEIPQAESQDAISANKIDSFDIEFKDGKTRVDFKNPLSSIKKITFTQNQNSVTYISRQDINHLEINYHDFEKFSEGQVKYKIESADLKDDSPLKIENQFTSTSTKTFTATNHYFSTNDSSKISTTLPNLKSSTSTISFSGTVKTNTNLKALVVKPNGFIDEVTLSTSSTPSSYFGTPIINSGSDFQFSYKPAQSGTYIVEINDYQGIATINHPVYINNGIPLIPDFFDLNTRAFFTDNFDLKKLRNQMLDLINDARKKHNLDPVELSDELNTLAQNHTDDMAENNYFSHIDLQNRTPNQRAQAAGITTSVSENIAQDISIPFAHEGFMRSASHRSNILTADWTRVGLGVTFKGGYLIVGQEFSTEPLQSENIQNYKNELLSEITQLRGNSLTYQTKLEQASNDLNNQIINDNVTLTNSIFSNTLETYNIGGSSQAIGRNSNSWATILSSIINDEAPLLKDLWQNIGVDIQVDNSGILHTLLILNK